MPQRRQTGHLRTRRQQLQRTRTELRRRNYLPQACPRCHRERVVDTHELIRRSQHLAGIADLELMVELGRQCHDWVGGHPDDAVTEGWAMWRWQLHDLAARAAAQLARLEIEAFGSVRDVAYGDSAGNVLRMPRPKSGRVTVTFRLDPDDVEWLELEAARREIDRSECLRRFIAAQRAQPAAAVEARLAVTSTGRARGPVPKSGAR